MWLASGRIVDAQWITGAGVDVLSAASDRRCRETLPEGAVEFRKDIHGHG